MGIDDEWWITGGTAETGIFSTAVWPPTIRSLPLYVNFIYSQIYIFCKNLLIIFLIYNTMNVDSAFA